MRETKKTTLKFCLCILSIILIVGCSDYVVKNPLKNLNVEDLFERKLFNRGPSVSQGMTKYAVLKKWGYPDERRFMGEGKFGAPIERWTYYAWIPGFPINYRYVAKEYRLYFHGNILMECEDTDLLKPKASELKGAQAESTKEKKNP